MAFLENRVSLSTDDVQVLDGHQELNSAEDVDMSLQLRKGRSLLSPVVLEFDTSLYDSLNAALPHLGRGGGCFASLNTPADKRAQWMAAIIAHNCFPEVRPMAGLLGAGVDLTTSPDEVEFLITDGCAEMIFLQARVGFRESIFDKIEEIGPVCEENNVILSVGTFSDFSFVRHLVQNRPEAAQYVDMLVVESSENVGRPLWQAVHDLYHELCEMGLADRYKIVARQYGGRHRDMAKLLGAGASCVMTDGGNLRPGDDGNPALTPSDDIYAAGFGSLEDFIGEARFARVLRPQQ